MAAFQSVRMLCAARMLRPVAVLAACLLAPLVHAGPQLQQWTAPSGARVTFIESRAIAVLDVAVEAAAGSSFDPAGKAGLARLTHALLRAGGESQPERAIGERLADAGAQLGTTFDRDRAGYNLRVLSGARDRGPALAVLATLLAEPSFAPDTVAREKARLQAQVREAETRPEAIAERRLYERMYPGHPYGVSTSIESVAGLAEADVRAFHARHHSASRSVVTIVGDVSRAEAERIAQDLTARLPRTAAADAPPDRAPSFRPPSAPAGTLRVAHPAEQSHVVMGMPVAARDDPDYVALLVGNHVLGGGGFTSRLFREIRDKRGFAYSVYSYFLPLAVEGPYLLGLQTRRDQSEAALAELRSQLAAFVERGPDARELQAAKRSLVAGFPLRIDSNRKMLDQAAVIGFYRLPADWLDQLPARIAKVTLSEVRDAYSRRVDPQRMATVVVAGDARH
jgi:zinc protease